MIKTRWLLCLAGMLVFPAFGATVKSAGQDLDPEALAILKSWTDTLSKAQNFSFRARVSRDLLGTNGQIVTVFQDQQIIVSRPGKLYADVRGVANEHVRFFYDGKQAVLFEVDKKLYSSVPATGDLDQLIAALHKRGIPVETADLLISDPYKSLIDGLNTAYVVGALNFYDKVFYQVAFTENDVDWQLWVEPGEKQLPRRIEAIFKKREGMPRISLELTEWNLSPEVKQDQFTFSKPEGARQIDFLPAAKEK
jgi:hypothetical protein